jgi:hypothetical protein
LAQFARARCPAWSAQLGALAARGGDWRRRRTAKEWRGAWEEALAGAGWLADAAATPLGSDDFNALARLRFAGAHSKNNV